MYFSVDQLLLVRGVVISVEYISVDFQRVWWIPMGPMGPCRARRSHGPMKEFDTLMAGWGREAKRQPATSMGRRKKGEEEKRGIPDA